MLKFNVLALTLINVEELLSFVTPKNLVYLLFYIKLTISSSIFLTMSDNTVTNSPRLNEIFFYYFKSLIIS